MAARKSAKVREVPLVPGEGPAEEAWETYFQSNKPHPGAVADVVLRLQREKRSAEIVACLEAALRNGQGQPWMYTVLALEMEQIGRPADQVKRVLLSIVDTNPDVANLLYTAAFLTRFGARDKALVMYRQASLADPGRLEPYIMGLRLAAEADDVEATVWSATGILQRAWEPGYEQLHRQAVSTAEELAARLRKAGDDPSAERVEEALKDAQQRDLIVELTWSGKADLDLLVEEPGGSVCSFENPHTPAGGVFAHDGHGGDQKDAFDRYVCPRGMPGEYRIRVRYVSGSVVGKRAVLKITRYQGTPQEVVDTQSIELTDEDKVVRVSLNRGRLQELGWTPLLRGDRAARREQATGSRIETAGRRGSAGGQAGRDRRGAGAGVGYQPVIQVLPDGISNNVLAIVSADRRYVRLSMTPTFSSITDVFTFSFLNTGGNPSGGGRTGGATGGGGNVGGGLQ